MNRTDTQLVSDYLNGDEKSLEFLIRRYLKSIYSFVYKYAENTQDAEDITQDIFVKAWKNIKRFNDDKNFKTWIFTIAKNTCIDWLKKKKTMPFSSFENEEGENAFTKSLVDSSASKVFERLDMVQFLQSAIDKILPKYQLVLSLRYNSNLSFREIAKTLKEPLNTVKSRHRRAIDTLKKNLIEFY